MPPVLLRNVLLDTGTGTCAVITIIITEILPTHNTVSVYLYR